MTGPSSEVFITRERIFLPTVIFMGTKRYQEEEGSHTSNIWKLQTRGYYCSCRWQYCMFWYKLNHFEEDPQNSQALQSYGLSLHNLPLLLSDQFFGQCLCEVLNLGRARATERFACNTDCDRQKLCADSMRCVSAWGRVPIIGHAWPLTGAVCGGEAHVCV